MSNKTLEQQIRLVMEGQANAATLEYGTDKARDTYAKDTPGQTPGVEHDPVQHQHKPNLALDGVPVPGGELKKPNFEKDAGMGKVAEAKEMKVKNCGCDKDPCETYGSAEEQMNERNTNVKDAGKTKAIFKIGKAKPIPGHPDYKGPQNPQGVKEQDELDEAGRWENTTSGRAYRRLSPEEKARRAKANMLKKRSGAPKSKVKAPKIGIGKLKSVYKGSMRREDVMSDLIADLEMAYLGEAMSDSERKQAAAKIFRMHQAKQAAKQASAALGKKSDPAAKAARRDSAGYKTSDDSHLDSKPKAPEKKRGRGERDLPHIVSQLRGVVDTKDGKPSAVKFKDGTTKSVSPDHAKKWLKKHDSAKPADKLSMYKSHDSHKSFQSHVGEDVETVNELSSKTYKDYIRKAASPVNKGSAVNLASKGAHKLATSDNMDAGEKEDKKAFNRGRGIQRAAKKLYGRTNESAEKMAGQEYRTQMAKVKSKDPAIRKAISNIYDKKPSKLRTLQDVDHPDVKAAKKYMNTEAWFDTNSYPTHKDHRKKTADRKTADTLNKPDTLKKRQQMHPAHRKAYDAKVRQSNYDKHGVGSKKETTPLDKKLHHPDVKAP